MKIFSNNRMKRYIVAAALLMICCPLMSISPANAQRAGKSAHDRQAVPPPPPPPPPTNRPAPDPRAADTSRANRPARRARTDRPAPNPAAANAPSANRPTPSPPPAADIDNMRDDGESTKFEPITDGALILEHANSNENIYMSATGEFISYLRGDVVFRFEDIRITADEANWQRHAGIVDFNRNIRVEQRGQLMTCERLQFVRDRNVLTASSRVVYRDSSRITAIRGDTAEYMTNRKEARLFGNPLLTRIDSADANIDTIFLRGRIVVYDDSLKIATVTDSVSIKRGSLTALGQRGRYFVNDDKATLRVDPVIYYESHRVTGDSVDLFFSREALKSACVTGNSHGYYRNVADSTGDTTVTNIWSDSLHLSMFESGKIDAMKAFGNARGDYAEISPASNNRAETRFASDSMHTFMFESGKVRAIKAFGGARGNYSEVNDSTKSAMATNLSSDSLHISMFETGKVRALTAYGSAHGRSSELSASSAAKDSSITHIWGDSLRVSMNDGGKIRAMRAFGSESSNVRSQNFTAGDSARVNEVTGHIMTLVFDKDSKLERAIVVGDAKSLYHLEESDGGGSNRAAGERIIVTFASGKAQRLRVIGNVKGFYAP